MNHNYIHPNSFFQFLIISQYAALTGATKLWSNIMKSTSLFLLKIYTIDLQSSGRKKIILIGPAYPYRGGNSLYVTHVYNQLKNEFDVTVYNYKLLYPSLFFPGTTQYDKSSQPISPPPNKRLVNSINPFNWLRVASLLKKENADLVVFDWWHPFFAFCHFTISKLISQKYRNKILFITENIVSHESQFFEKALTLLGLKNASFFMALSGVVEKELREYFPGKQVFRSELPVYDCYDMDKSFDASAFRKQLGYAPKDKILLFFGYVRKYKGLNVLIQAMPETLESIPDAKLLVVGEFYDDETSYTNLVRANHLQDSVEIINRFVSNEEVGNYYSIADVVVLPYLSATQSGILNVAYGFHKPVVVTDVGGLTESVEEGKTGVITVPGDSKKLAEAAVKFFELSRTVNFAENIKRKITENSFSNLPQTFREILKLSG